MAVSESLCRLLRLRALEEEQHKLALDSALADLHRIESARNASYLRARSAREQLAAAAQSTDVADRIAGIVEAESAERDGHLLEIRLLDGSRRAAQLRETYLSKRAERKQVETIIRQAESREALESARRDQRRVDDWFNARGQVRRIYRQDAEESEMKGRKESGPISQGELRS